MEAASGPRTEVFEQFCRCGVGSRAEEVTDDHNVSGLVERDLEGAPDCLHCAEMPLLYEAIAWLPSHRENLRMPTEELLQALGQGMP